MSNKVYYGEYSLDHWIKLILEKNIILPDYQRYFVWNDDKRKKLINTLKNKEFVPPVIIGSFTKDDQKENLLIDGQQRLTSILLSFLGYFPDRKKYKKEQKEKNSKFIDENDDDFEEDIDVINWSFRDLLEDKEDKIYTINELKEKLSKSKFFNQIKDEDKIDEKFLKNTYLGFSYLIPENNKSNDQQRYYSSVFRHINIQGIDLTTQESRESLYYLSEEKKSFFKPSFLELYEGSTLDFVRYISILSQYKKDGNSYTLCQGYGSRKDKMEEFYADYIELTVSGEKNDRYWSYDDLFPEGEHKIELGKLKEVIEYTKLYKKSFESIIDLDMYYFGLIYWFLFEKKDVKKEVWENVEKKIDDQIKIYKYPYLDKDRNPVQSPEYKNGEDRNYHPKNPSSLKYIRERAQKSIDIYKEFFGVQND